jgi:hypothetical protein
MAGAGRRLLLEAIFLVCLAVAAGLAEFSTEEIIEVMALGWLVTVLIELVAWRLAVRRPAVEERPIAPAQAAPVVAAPPPPEAVAPAPEPEIVAEPAEHAVAADEAAGGLRPAQPKRGGLFGWRRRAEIPGEITDELPPVPKHVRLIERAEAGDAEKSAGDRDASTAERAGGA